MIPTRQVSPVLRVTTAATTVCMGMVACTGCVERSETITIARDGSVIIELEYEGSEEELASGDAMPSIESGWHVVRSTRKEGDEIKHILKTKRRFEPGEPLPSGFASPDDPDADLYLSFPTTLRIEKRRDGTYYYFHRTYTPRRWAYVRHWQDVGFDDHIKKISEKPTEELTFDDRVQLALAFAGFEAFKQLEFADAAAAESGLDLAVEHWLIARRALMNMYDEELEVREKNGVYSGRIVRIIESCEQLPEPQQDECFDEEADSILGAAYDAYIQSLRDEAGLAEWRIAAFEEAYARAKRYYEITDRLGGHAFEIYVAMPGVIIAHNALDDDTDVDEDTDTSRVRFQFEGDWFRDRPFEMIVVSKLEHDRGPGNRSPAHGADR